MIWILDVSTRQQLFDGRRTDDEERQEENVIFVTDLIVNCPSSSILTTERDLSLEREKSKLGIPICLGTQSWHVGVGDLWRELRQIHCIPGRLSGEDIY